MQNVDGIEGRIDRKRPAPRLVAFHKGDQRLESVAVLRAVAGASEGLDLSQRGAVVFVRANNLNLHISAS